MTDMAEETVKAEITMHDREDKSDKKGKNAKMQENDKTWWEDKNDGKYQNYKKRKLTNVTQDQYLCWTCVLNGQTAFCLLR